MTDTKGIVLLKLCWVIAAFVLLLIVRPWNLYFMADDFIYVSLSPQLQYLYRTAFRPVSDLTLLCDYTFYGTIATGYHITNFALHLIASVLCGVFCGRMAATFQYQASAFVAHIAAIVFLCYPFLSESVFWIIGRGASLATIWILLALILLLRSRSFGLVQAIMVIAFFILGLLTYETSWLLPLLASVIGLFGKKFMVKDVRQRRNTIIVLWVLLFASFVLRWLAIGNLIGSPYLNTDKFEASPIKMAYNYFTGFYRAFIHPTQDSRLFVAIAILITIGLLYAARWYRNRLRQQKIYVLLFVLFAIALLPVALLAVNTHTSESERFLYLPAVFLCCLVSFVFIRIKNWVPYFSAYLVLGLFGFYQSSNSYLLASQWNKATIEALSKKKGIYQKILVSNAPSHYRGGFMFRLGLREAIDWLAPSVKYHQFEILNHQVVQNDDALEITINNPIAFPDKVLELSWEGNKLFIRESPVP